MCYPFCMIEKPANDNPDRRGKLSALEERLYPQIQGARRAIEAVLGGKRWEKKPDDTERRKLEKYSEYLVVLERHMETRPPGRTSEFETVKIVSGVNIFLAKFIPPEDRKEFNLDPLITG